MALRRRQGLRHCVDLYVLLRGQATHTKGNIVPFLGCIIRLVAMAKTEAKSAFFQKRSANTVLSYTARSTRVSISPRNTSKSMGLVKSVSAPASNALRLVSASP